MPDGEMRRPPQLWEQRLSKVTSVIAAGVQSSSATSIVNPSPVPGTDGGVEPAPVLPPPGEFVAPSTPTLIASVQGINVVWNGLNSAGDLWPSDTSYVEVHMATSGPTFTCGTATLKGRLARPGGLAVTGLSRGTTYYFRLRGADSAGNVTDPSTAASAQPGQIDAPDIAANAITANSIVAGTITGWSINSAYLSGGTVSGGYITGGTIQGSSYRTASSGARVEMGDAFSTAGYISFYGSSSLKGYVFANPSGGLAVTGNNLGVQIGGGSEDVTVGRSISATAGSVTSAYLYVSGAAVDMPGVYTNNTTGIDSVGITTGYRLRRISSSQDIKYDITPLAGSLSSSVDPGRITDVVTVDPSAVLDIAVTEFSVIDDGEPTERRVLGFIADDVADKLPIAATYGEDGTPAGVLDTALVAALLAVVKEQQATISALTARIEALEG